jgi:hypothetical protein
LSRNSIIGLVFVLDTNIHKNFPARLAPTLKPAHGVHLNGGSFRRFLCPNAPLWAAAPLPNRVNAHQQATQAAELTQYLPIARCRDHGIARLAQTHREIAPESG